MAVYGNNELFTIYTHDGSTKERAAPSLNHLVEIGISTNGFYWVNPSLGSTTPIYIYVNFSYRTKEAWALVLSNRINTTGVANSLYTADGVNGATSQGSVTYDKGVNFKAYGPEGYIETQRHNNIKVETHRGWLLWSNES